MTRKRANPRVEISTIGQDVDSDVEVDISVCGDYGLEGLLDEWLKGAEFSLWPLHEELIKG